MPEVSTQGGAEGGTRTHTPLREADFKSASLIRQSVAGFLVCSEQDWIAPVKDTEGAIRSVGKRKQELQ